MPYIDIDHEFVVFCIQAIHIDDNSCIALKPFSFWFSLEDGSRPCARVRRPSGDWTLNRLELLDSPVSIPPANVRLQLGMIMHQVFRLLGHVRAIS